eukprot:8264854-Prorocentrum_lima.AAC.1
MTSSLVGSEMCIRDRPTPQRPTTERARRARQQRQRLSPLPLLDFQCPVSYTHLTLPTICSV